jgi:hypothetical protein
MDALFCSNLYLHCEPDFELVSGGKGNEVPYVICDGESSRRSSRVPDDDLSLVRFTEKSMSSELPMFQGIIEAMRLALEGFRCEYQALVDVRDNFRRQAWMLSGKGSPINRLPPELLAGIFEAIPGDDPSVRVRSIVLVCRHWYDVATNTTSLWRNILIEQSTPGLFEPDARWLARSNATPLSVALPRQRDATYSVSQELSALLLTHVRRVQQLEISVPNPFKEVPLWAYEPVDRFPLTGLRCLRIRPRDSEHCGLENYDMRSLLGLSSSESDSVSELRLSSALIPFPWFSASNFGYFSNLSALGITGTGNFIVDELFLHRLGDIPNLQRLCLQFVCPRNHLLDPVPETPSQGPPVALHSVVELVAWRVPVDLFRLFLQHVTFSTNGLRKFTWCTTFDEGVPEWTIAQSAGVNDLLCELGQNNSDLEELSLVDVDCAECFQGPSAILPHFPKLKQFEFHWTQYYLMDMNESCFVVPTKRKRRAWSAIYSMIDAFASTANGRGSICPLLTSLIISAEDMDNSLLHRVVGCAQYRALSGSPLASVTLLHDSNAEVCQCKGGAQCYHPDDLASLQCYVDGVRWKDSRIDNPFGQGWGRIIHDAWPLEHPRKREAQQNGGSEFGDYSPIGMLLAEGMDYW